MYVWKFASFEDDYNSDVVRIRKVSETPSCWSRHEPDYTGVRFVLMDQIMLRDIREDVEGVPYLKFNRLNKTHLLR